MPDIALPNTFVAGDVASAYKVAENLYSPTDPDSTFAVINGGLDRENTVHNGSSVSGGAYIDHHVVQSGALHRAVSVGSTLNLDYFQQLFTTFDVNLEGANDVDTIYIPIAKANTTFRVPWASTTVLLMWSIALANDAQNILSGQDYVSNPKQESLLRLFIDGDSYEATRRGCYNSVDVDPAFWSGSTPYLAQPPRYGDGADLYYSGHYLIPSMSKGWHTAGLWVAQSCNMSRVRVANMNVVVLR